MTTCAKCGAENVAGDAFCGNCGAFLEFAAEEAQTAEVGALVGAGEARAAEPSAPVSVAAPNPPGPAGPTCAACGRVNPAGRRFCISCGERLPAASSTSAAGAGPETPPGARPAKPAWEFPTAPIPAAAAPVAPVAPVPAAASSRGGSRLPLIGGALVVLALVAGGVVLVLGSGGNLGARTSSATPSVTPGPEPSSGPTVSAESPTPETPAATEAPSIPPEPTAPAATVPPGPSVGIVITAAKGSSQLAASRGPKYLHDGSPVTAWMSRAGKVEGSWVEVSFAATAVTKIQVWTGWQKDEPHFYGNHRPRNVTVAFDGGVPVPLVLKDVLGAQGVAIPPALGIVAATRLRITIIDTYPSRKTSAGGSPSKEVAISEIRVFGVPAAP